MSRLLLQVTALLTFANFRWQFPDIPGVVIVVIPNTSLGMIIECIEQTSAVVANMPLDRSASPDHIGNVALYCDELNHRALTGFWYVRFNDGRTTFRHSFSAVGIQMTPKFIDNFVKCVGQRVIALRNRMFCAMDGVPYTQVLNMDN
jgi:hypothetical protein